MTLTVLLQFLGAMIVLVGFTFIGYIILLGIVAGFYALGAAIAEEWRERHGK